MTREAGGSMPSLDEASGVIHLIDTKAIEEDFRASPQIANQELNRASQGIGGASVPEARASRASRGRCGPPASRPRSRGERRSTGSDSSSPPDRLPSSLMSSGSPSDRRAPLGWPSPSRSGGSSRRKKRRRGRPR